MPPKFRSSVNEPGDHPGMGWLGVSDLPGWEGFNISVRAAVVDGQPRVIGLHLDPVGGADGTPITSARLRGFPATELAALALARGRLDTRPGVQQAIAAAARRTPSKVDSRAATSVEQVAEIFRLAREAGRPPRAEICDRLNISPRTADRYIRRARDSGLLDGY